MLSAPIWTILLAENAMAACSSSANLLTLNCSGTLSTPITAYDAAAAYQAILGSNSYTPANPAFPAASHPNNPGYNPNPPNVTLNFDNTVSFIVTNPATSFLADKGLIVANYSNNESPAVGNVVINNFGAIGLSTNQIASRMDTIVGDSQVNHFTVNNKGAISATQTFFTSFNPANLTATASGTPATYTAKYSGTALNNIAALYSDDNTNEFTLINATGASVLATGNYASAYYGRADTTITNYGTISNTSWTPSDTLATGHWSIATWAGADFEALSGTNPDSPLNVVSGITKSGGIFSGSIAVTDTSATTITNKASGVIQGDVLVLDVTPLVYAANGGASAAISGTNAGPRDSNIENYGQINGNFYLGSGTHVIDNAAGATMNSNFSVDQRPSTATFSVANIFSTTPSLNNTPLNGEPAANQQYYSAGGTDFSGNACPAVGSATTDAGCATTTKVLASYAGGQSFTLTNEGTLKGDIVINDQSSSVNSISLTGSGFSGNIIALNGAGSNSLVLNGVTNLASVNNFSFLDLTRSQVSVTPNTTTVTSGVSLVDGATLGTTIFGHGGTSAAPSANLGSLSFVGGGAANTLTLQGATTILPTFAGVIHNGDVYRLASSVAGDTADITVANTSALVTLTPDTSTGGLQLDAATRSAASIGGMSRSATATLTNLFSYTGNNSAVQGLGGAVESLTSLSAVRQAAEQLKPEVNGASSQVPIDLTTAFQSQISNRLDSLFYGGLAGQQGRSADYSPPRQPVIVQPTSGGWGNGVGSLTQQQAVDGSAGYKAQGGGVIAGYDRLFNNQFRFGGAIGYATSEVNDSVYGRSQSIDLYQGLLYGSVTQSNWYLNGSFGVAGLNYNTTRTVLFSTFSDTAKGTHDGMVYSGRLDSGYAFNTSVGILVPVGSFTYVHIDQNAYQENSMAGAALAIARQETDSARSGIGMKAIFPILVDPNFAFAFEAKGIYEHEFANTRESVTASFVGADASFLATGPALSRDMADVGAGLRFSRPRDGETFSLSYNAIVRERYVDHIGMLKARIDF
jgi:uncharacterized protein with beta-barrel porin domain